MWNRCELVAELRLETSMNYDRDVRKNENESGFLGSFAWGELRELVRKTRISFVSAPMGLSIEAIECVRSHAKLDRIELRGCERELG